MRIAVIGAGVLGLCAAYQLMKHGDEVVLIERERPCAGASGRSFAWINANHKQPEPYHWLNREGIAEHESLQAAHPESEQWFHQTGCLLIDYTHAAPETYAGRLKEAEELSYPVRNVAAQEIRDLEPGISGHSIPQKALFFPSEGHLDIETLASFLLSELARHGTPIISEHVESLELSNNRVRVHMADSVLETDRVIIAAGEQSSRLAATVGARIDMADTRLPCERTHSFLGITEPGVGGVERVIVSDRINVRPRHDGSLFVQIPRSEHRTAEYPSSSLLNEVASAMEQELEILTGRRIRIHDVVLSARSLPDDGLTVAGPLDRENRIFALVTHSGMTLGPLLGRLAAEEIHGISQSMLSPFRPDRFAGSMKRVASDDFIGRQ